MTREQAIATAAKFGLQAEVIWEMDHNNCTPEEALSEWDILQVVGEGCVFSITHNAYNFTINNEKTTILSSARTRYEQLLTSPRVSASGRRQRAVWL